MGEYGLEPGDRVALLLGNSLEWFDTTFGLLRCGLVRTYLNPRHSTAEIGFQIADSGAKVLVIGEEHVHHLDSLDLGGVGDVIVVNDEYLRRLDSATPYQEIYNVPADYPAELRYTSGTTGKPKGAVQTHGSWNSFANAFAYHCNYRGDDRLLHVGPMTHASGAMAYPLLVAGGSQVIHQGFDPVELVEAIPKHGITCMLLVPTMIYMLLEHIREREIDASTLRSILYAAAPMAPSRLEVGLELLGPVFQQVYALTEFLGPVTILDQDEHQPGNARLSSVGRQAVGCELLIADEDGNELPRGEIGELIVRGERVIKEYWNRPEATGEVFTAEGFLRTNDLGRMDEDGYVYLVDRRSEMIISGGFNVYPAEVENALMAHQLVLEAAAFGIPDDTWGEAVHATVRIREGSTLTEEELREFSRGALGSYKVPKGITFTQDELPKGPTGKLLRRVLRSPYWEGQDNAVH